MGPGPFLVGRTPHQKTHPGKKSPNCVFCVFFGNKKDARRPYNPFGGGIAPRSLLCVRKRRCSFCEQMSKFCVRFAKNDHREPCVTVCPSEKWSSSLMCCPAVCWHMSWIPEKMIIIRHVLATCVWERRLFCNHHQRLPSSYMNVDLPHNGCLEFCAAVRFEVSSWGQRNIILFESAAPYATPDPRGSWVWWSSSD